jgi:hypothetical protein
VWKGQRLESTINGNCGRAYRHLLPIEYFDRMICCISRESHEELYEGTSLLDASTN